ncbi:MFS transporter [Tsukamurella tyrosinosolvens]|uniref:MFS transporter n=1 Tax=Tsukamurella tyrosinosolvens TaxID=57704 RepID=UPI000C7E9320|nr:MFS transporter [Tsukamurella tyrosinosolvens]AUN41820.1 MFS transporter [Tsukamurella tyrosinosolvens]
MVDAEPIAGTEQLSRKKRWRVLGVSALTTSLEYYDFYVYATIAAVVFNVTIFANDDPVTAAVNSFATLAVGALARPIGGIIAGHYGDRFGRKPVLVAGTVLMGVSTTLVGCVPNTQIVWLSPLILVTLRICQGLAVGAGWGGAVLMATEYAPAGRRGLYGSFAQLGIPLGLIGANVTVVTASAALGPDQFLSWGWRIPFWASSVILVVSFLVHRFMEDTPEFRRAEQKIDEAAAHRSPMLQVIRQHPRLIISAALTYLIGIVVFYTTATSSLEFATSHLDIERNVALLVVLISAAVCIPLTPLCGHLSDRFGRVRIYKIGIVAMAAWAVPGWILMSQAGPENLWPLIVAIGVATLTMCFQQGTQATLFAELFPPEVRFSGVSTSYSVAAVIASFSPMVAVLLVDGSASNGWRVGAMTLALGVVALVCLRAVVPTHRSRAEINSL